MSHMSLEKQPCNNKNNTINQNKYYWLNDKPEIEWTFSIMLIISMPVEKLNQINTANVLFNLEIKIVTSEIK